jgi:hypothetical protein
LTKVSAGIVRDHEDHAKGMTRVQDEPCRPQPKAAAAAKTGGDQD